MLKVDEQREILQDSYIWFGLLSALMLIFGWISYACMMISAERVAAKLRALYLDALMKQEIAFFEKQPIEQLPGKLFGYFREITETAGEKVQQLISAIAAISGGVIFGLFINPTYTLSIATYMPVFGYILHRIMKKQIGLIIAKMTANAQLGGFIEETLSAMKLIISFGEEEWRMKEYDLISKRILKTNVKTAVGNGAISGAFIGIVIGQSLFSWIIAGFFFQREAKNYITGELITLSEVFACYQALLYGLMQILAVTNLIPAIYRMKITGKQVINVIERVPLVRNIPFKAKQKINLSDGIHFKGVHFRYPTAAPDIPNIFAGANFKVKTGTSTAIVGPSGSGKSTTVQLINRFYDPDEGDIYYGSDNLKEVDLVALRNQIGYVGQEPVLIIGTIEENLLYGKCDATEEEMREALSLANADFVFNLAD